MGPSRNKSVSVRLEEEAYLRLRRHRLRSGVPTSALVRAPVPRWLHQQGDAGRGRAPPARGRRHRRRGGGPTSALVRALVHRWLQEQGDEEGEAMAERGGSERRRQLGLFGEGGEL